MTTIGKMVVEVGGDESGLRQSMGRSLQLVRDFSEQATQQMLKAVPAGPKAADLGLDFAKGIIEGANREMRVFRANLVEQLVGGQITIKQFQEKGRLAAQAYNKAIEEGLRQLRDFRPAGTAFDESAGRYRNAKGRFVKRSDIELSPEENLRAFETLTRAVKMEGVRSAEAYVQGLEEEMAKRRAMMASAMARNVRSALGVAQAQTAGAAKGAGQNIGRQIGLGFAVSALFNLESIMRAQGKVEKAAAGVRQALQSVAVFAATSFGPEGLIVAGLAAGAAAIIDYFAESRRQMRDTRKAFEDEVKRMIDAGDSIGLQVKLREVERGKPSAGMGAGGFFKGSLGDLQTQYNALVDRKNSSNNLIEVLRIKRQMDALWKQMMPLVQEQRQLKDAILNRPDALPDITGLPAIRIEAKGPGGMAKDAAAAAREAAAQFREWLDRGRDILAIFGDMKTEGAGTADVAERLLRIYDDMAAMLERMPDSWSAQGRELRKMISEIRQNADIIDILRGGGYAAAAKGLPITSTSPTGTPLPPGIQGLFDNLKNFKGVTAAKPQSFGFGDLLAGEFGKVGTMISGMLSSALGPMVIVAKILEPGLRALEPLLDSLIAPLAAVVQVVAVGLEPVFRLLFPIVKAVAIAFSFLMEVSHRVTAGLAHIVGSVIKAIGGFIRKIPGLGGFGKSIQRAGQSILDFGAGLTKSADQMKETRKKLEGMEFGDTIDSVTGLGAAADAAANSLRNVPEIFKMSLQQMRAFGIPTAGQSAATTLPGTASGSGGGFTVEQITIQGGNGKPREIAEAVVRELQRLAEAQYGDAGRWAEVTV